MVAKLTVIFFIIVCLLVGVFLVLLPWLNLNQIGDWGNNYFLSQIARATDMPGLQAAVASGWVRGAVTGLGIFNILMAFWEIANFKAGVKRLERENDESGGEK